MPGCGAHRYENIKSTDIEIMLHELRAGGAVVKGDNPWHVEVRQYGMTLKGVWNDAESTLTIIVVDVGWCIPCRTVWKRIDSLISTVQETDVQLGLA